MKSPKDMTESERVAVYEDRRRQQVRTDAPITYNRRIEWSEIEWSISEAHFVFIRHLVSPHRLYYPRTDLEREELLADAYRDLCARVPDYLKGMPVADSNSRSVWDAVQALGPNEGYDDE